MTEIPKRPTQLAVSLVQIADAIRMKPTTLSACFSIIDTDSIRPIKHQARSHTPVRTLYALEAVHMLFSRIAANRYTAAAAAELQAVATEVEVR